MRRPDPTRIHPTAVVSPDARLADDVTVGPFTIIEGAVTLGPGCKVGPHCHLIGPLAVGRGNRFHAGCVIGDEPQHLGYKGEATRTEIGESNTFREYVTVHRGMPVADGAPGTGVTLIGNHNLLMANAHVAHDCRVGDRIVFANGAVIGGHAEIHDGAVLSGNSAVHQFCRVGRLGMLGGTSAVSQDLPPFWVIQGGINEVHGVNIVGMRRAGLATAEISAIRHAFRLLNRSGLTIPAAVAELEAAYPQVPSVRVLIDFLRTSRRGVCLSRGKRDDAD